MTKKIYLAQFSLGLVLALCACDGAAPAEGIDSDDASSGEYDELQEDRFAHEAGAEAEEHGGASERVGVDAAGSARCEHGAFDAEPEVFEVEPPARGLVEPRFRVEEDQATVALRLEGEAEAYDAAHPALEDEP